MLLLHSQDILFSVQSTFEFLIQSYVCRLRTPALNVLIANTSSVSSLLDETELKTSPRKCSRIMSEYLLSCDLAHHTAYFVWKFGQSSLTASVMAI
jgi:hypothetical protein